MDGDNCSAKNDASITVEKHLRESKKSGDVHSKKTPAA
jgi:hypothetical protein